MRTTISSSSPLSLKDDEILLEAYSFVIRQTSVIIVPSVSVCVCVSLICIDFRLLSRLRSLFLPYALSHITTQLFYYNLLLSLYPSRCSTLLSARITIYRLWFLSLACPSPWWQRRREACRWMRCYFIFDSLLLNTNWALLLSAECWEQRRWLRDDEESSWPRNERKRDNDRVVWLIGDFDVILINLHRCS